MENELMKLWQVPRSSWLVSGQDEPARAALLQAELARRGLRVIVATEEAVPAAVQAARRAGFKRLRTLPAAGEEYFPAFTLGRATERESRLLELLRVQGWEEAEVGKANVYLDFILGLDETVHRAPPQLDMKLLQKYRGVFGVERALWKLGLDEDTRRIWLEAYAECASAGPRIENFLRGLEASLHLDAPRAASPFSAAGVGHPGHPGRRGPHRAGRHRGGTQVGRETGGPAGTGDEPSLRHPLLR